MIFLGIEGLYFVLTGLWPLISIGTFERVTGPKTDHWLVKTVGLLISVLGAVILIAYSRRNASPEILFLAVASAFVLMVIDVVYVLRGVLRPVYLLDAVVEGIFIVVGAAYWYSI